MAVNFKDEVLVRIYAITAVIVLPAALLLAYKTLEIGFLERAEFLAKGQQYFKTVEVAAERGNIYSRGDNLLATSVPYFSLHFDPFVAAPDVYYDNLDSLALLLSRHADPDFTVGAWRDSLINMRDSINRPARHYYKIKESVGYAELQTFQQFPIFDRGRLGGGLIVNKRDERKRPFGWLARRTIGKTNGRKVGIEGAFDTFLAGEKRRETMFRVDRNLWLPMEDLNTVEPTSGANVHTTLDVNIQDIAENALDKAVKLHRPDWGAAIVMDVRTGAIRAMANLGKNREGNKYFEHYNYAIANATEPGSTFKLATMMALLEDGHVDLEDEIDIENGQKDFYEETLRDDNPRSRNWRKIRVQDAFEQSSNVGMAKLVDSFYRDNPTAYFNRLRSFHIGEKTGLEIQGEGSPMLTDTSTTTYSGITLPWMAIGYETLLTPIQMLTYYNAVANGGTMMKPYLVTDIRRDGRVVKRFKPTVIDERIAAPRTIDKLQLLLEGVVQNGTASKLKSRQYNFAGKTGTSRQDIGGSRRARRQRKYQASFAGYFPAENPTYSVVVVIYNPTSGSYYGGQVALPVFRDIADRIYNSMIDVHEPLNQGPRPVLYADQLPNNDAGYLPEIATVLNYVNVSVDSFPEADLGRVVATEEEVVVQAFDPDEKFPDVRGMRLRDAVYVLENRGYVVHPQGVGRVTAMKWQRDGRGRRGRDVNLILN